MALHVADVEETIDVESSPWADLSFWTNWVTHIVFVVALLALVAFAIKNIM